MQRVLDGVWTWAQWNEDRQLDFNGWYLDVGGRGVLVDPVPFGPGDAEVLERLGRPALVVVTNKDHVRAAPEARARFGAELWVPEADRALLDAPVDRTFRDGDLLAGALRVVGLPDHKSPGESALHWAARRVLVLGDALWGKPAGALSLLPAAKLADVARTKAGLRRLGALSVETILPGDGTPLLTGAGAVLAAWLASEAPCAPPPAKGPGAPRPGC